MMTEIYIVAYAEYIPELSSLSVSALALSRKSLYWTQALEQWIRCNMYTPYAGDQKENSLFGNKWSRLSFSFVYNRPMVSTDRCKSRNEADLAIMVVS